MLKTLLRVAPLAIAGYTIYRIYALLSRQPSAQPTPQRAITPPGTFDSTRLTGPGMGMQVETSDPSGTSVPHRVGRGVVRR